MAERIPSQRDIVDRHLRRAWQAAAPAPGLETQVRARLTGSTAATAGAVALGMASKARPLSAWSSLRASGKLGAMVGMGVFGLGLFSGYLLRDGRDQFQAAPVLPARIEQVSWALPSPAVVVAEREAGGAVLPAPDTTPAPSAEVAPEAPPSEPQRSVRRPVVRSPVVQPAAPERRVASTVNEPGQPSDELALLRRADRAVRGDEAALALALIGELDAHHPESKLLEERRAIELLAFCQAGSTDARLRTERFLLAHPHSVYAGRIREACPASNDLSTLTPR
jgi:hypothetical protein